MSVWVLLHHPNHNYCQYALQWQIGKIFNPGEDVEVLYTVYHVQRNIRTGNEEGLCTRIQCINMKPLEWRGGPAPKIPERLHPRRKGSSPHTCKGPRAVQGHPQVASCLQSRIPTTYDAPRHRTLLSPPPAAASGRSWHPSINHASFQSQFNPTSHTGLEALISN